MYRTGKRRQQHSSADPGSLVDGLQSQHCSGHHSETNCVLVVGQGQSIPSAAMLKGMGSELLVGQDAADGLKVSNHVSSFSGRSLLDTDGAVFSAPP